MLGKEVVGPFGVGVWKYIRKGWEVFSRFVTYEVGDGSKVRFWHDLWCVEQSLKISYLYLFSIARCKDTWVADHMLFRNGNFQWNVFFSRLMREVEVVSSFFELLVEE